MEIITNQGRKIYVSNNPLVYKYKGKVITYTPYNEYVSYDKLDEYAEFIDALEDDIFEFIMNNKVSYYEETIMPILAYNYHAEESLDTDNFKVTYIERELIEIRVDVYNEYRKLNIISFTDVKFSIDDKSITYDLYRSSNKMKNEILGKYLIGKSVKSALF